MGKADHKKVRVVLEFDNPHDPYMLVDIGLLLRDALGEFIDNRSVDYVRTRYANLSESERLKKKAQVERRLEVAEAMRRGIKDIDFGGAR